jgi:hypothetical protein
MFTATNIDLSEYAGPGVPGVVPVPFGKYAAGLNLDGVRHRLGDFDTAEEARDAVIAKGKELWLS